MDGRKGRPSTGFSPSPVVNGRHPWIFRKVHNNIHIKLITINLTVKQDPSTSAPSAQCLTPLLQRSIYRFITLTARSQASIANHLNITSNRRGRWMTADDGVFTVPGRQRASCRHLSARTGRTDLVPSRPSWRDLRRHYSPRPSDGTVENTAQHLPPHPPSAVWRLRRQRPL